MPQPKKIPDSDDADKISIPEALTPEQRLGPDALFSEAYEELKRLAKFVRRNEAHKTLNTTSLVHEAWLKLMDTPNWAPQSRAHARAIIARAMRRILVDEARRRNAHMRGGGAAPESLGDQSGSAMADNGKLPAFLALDEALRDLALLDERQAEMIDLKFFGGLTVPEIAVELGVSEATVERGIRAAKAFLGCHLGAEKE